MLALLITFNSYSQEKTIININGNEKWWVGVIDKGHLMPLSPNFKFDMVKANTYNQVQPLFISSKGRYVYSDEPVNFVVKSDAIEIIGKQKLTIENSGKTLKDAYLTASKKHFNFNGKYPDIDLFLNPQYNTWIELNYHQNQKDILNYADAMLKNGLPAGVLMIDDTWQHDYGYWDFDSSQFPNPKVMIDSLHQKGFKIMLWVCPFVSPDSRAYRELAKEGGLILTKDGKKPKLVNWWNGVSAEIDLSHPNGDKWFKAQLDNLIKKYGVDGFKFDAGDPKFYEDAKSYADITPHEQCRLYNVLGESYLLNEYRAAWKVGGAPLAQRLADKKHSWGDLQALIPEITLQGIMGYPFACPDMIGGGQIDSFTDQSVIDQELVVRSAQCHVFMPMMQFSVNPFRILDQTHIQAIKDAVVLRQKFVPKIVELVKQAAITGQPIVRMMDYEFPNQGFESVNDQFMLGDKYLIAPVVQKGATIRKVVLPKGKWQDENGKKYNGGKIIDIPVNLKSIPFFVKTRN